MRRLVLLALMTATLRLPAQQQVPGLERGLQPEKLYQFNGFDNISVYGGNLSMRVPLGMSHAGDGGLSYQFTVNYNGKFWDFKSGANWVHAYPASSSNAGLGWSFGFGRYIPKDHPANSFLNMATYESADGAQYPFGSVDPAAGNVWYARDANLRLRELSPTVVEVDFPDGTVQRHVKNGDGEWLLTEIRAPRGTDKATIDYLASRPSQCGSDTTSWWRVHDGPAANPRQHFVCFVAHEMDGETRPLVRSLVLHPSPAGPAIYTFEYTDVTGVSAPGEFDNTSNNWRLDHSVALLNEIKLPDGSGYSFEHSSVTADLLAVTLPTLTRVEYTYDDITSPSASLCTASESPELGLGSVMKGVIRRTVRPLQAAGRTAEAHVWNYRRTWKALNTSATNYDPVGQFYRSTYECTDPLNPNHTYRVPLFDVLIVSVEEPAVNGTYARVDSHFTAWPGDLSVATSPAGFDHGEYAYPHGLRDSAQDRHLSLEQYQCTSGVCTKLRTTYARHVGIGTARTAYRLESQRIVFNDDSGRCGGEECAVTTDYSDRDGYDHYRVETARHNFGGKGRDRTVTTDWNKINGVPRLIGPTERWFPNTYETITVQENGQVRVEQACFDLTTGFMTARRVLKGSSPGATDLITLFDLNGQRNLGSERFYGGDDGAVPTASGPLCNLLPSISGSPRYQVNHTWQNGVLSSTQYSGTTFKTLDLSVHRTGLVTISRDTAGVATLYSYDASGRIVSIEPPAGSADLPGAATTTYTYSNASTASGSLVPATATQTTGSGTSAVEAAYQFDSMGRLWREKRKLPDGRWSVRETLYDPLGRKHSVSEAEALPANTDLGFTPSAVTTFQYDALGRTLKIVAPDQSQTRFAYQGARQTSRFTKGPNDPEESRGTETYDGFGRLIQVSEQPDAGGAVMTEYSYEAGGKLAEVTMRSPDGTVQQRTFDYDGRGFLRWEQHPESGLSTYTYDARGQVLSKDQSAARSPFDLLYTYDAAARLLTVSGRNPLFGPASPAEPEFRLLKEFVYGTENGTYRDAAQVVTTDLVKGKLATATRYNYPPKGFDTVYKISDRYVYDDALGRHTVRETTIDTEPAAFAPKRITTAVRYNELGLPRFYAYPMCRDCGAPATPTRKDMVYAYAAGRLSSIAGFVTSVTFWPNGMRHELKHANDIVDKQVVGSMPRPLEISFQPHVRCVRPTVVAQPASHSVPSGGGSVTLSVTAAGSAELTYTWHNLTTGAVVGYTSSVTVQVTQESYFMVRLANGCGSVESNVARVTVGTCPAPQTGSITPVRQPDGSWVLTPKPVARSGATYVWRKLPENVQVGSGTTLAVANPDTSTTHSFTVTDSCGSSTSEVTIRIPLAITKTGLVARLSDSGIANEVVVDWPEVPGATSYIVQRRSGPAWTFVASRNVPNWKGLQPAGTTYAYRVYAIGEDSESEYSNADVATTRSFTEAVAGTDVDAAPVNSMLDAVNSVRAAAGWAPLSWSNILTATDPVPASGALVMGRHVTSCHARMTEALQALGVPVVPYVRQDLSDAYVSAGDINEVQRRTK